MCHACSLITHLVSHQILEQCSSLVDEDYEFIWIDNGEDGQQSDEHLFGDSDLKGWINNKSINFPDDDPLPNDDKEMPYLILGDDAPTLRTYLMKQYGKRGLNNEMMVAN